MWVVTREINEYDQDGSYFVAVFQHKPTFADLKSLLPNETDTTVGKLTKGGGRQGNENVWFNLLPVESGKNYT